MAVVAAQVTVGTTPVLLSQDDDRGGSSLLLQAPAAATLYVGGPTVTAASGFPVPAGTSLSVDLPDYNQLFGVLATGSSPVAVMRVGA